MILRRSGWSVASAITCGLVGVASTPAVAQVAGAPETSISDALLRWEALVHARFSALLQAIPRIPKEFARGFELAGTELNSGRPGMTLVIIAALILFGYLVEWAVKWMLTDRSSLGVRQGDSAPSLHRAALSEIPPLLVFAVASVGLFVMFDWQPLLRTTVLTFLAAFIVFRIVRTAARLVLTREEQSPFSDVSSDVAQDRVGEASYWLSRVSLFAGIFMFGWAFVSLMSHLQFSDDVRRLVAYAFGLGLLAVAVEFVWRRPRITPVSRHQASLLTLFLAGLWLLWVFGMFGLLWLGIYALLLPKLVAGVGRLSQSYAGSFTGTNWRATLAKVLIGRGARAIVIIAAVAWLLFVARFNVSGISDDSVSSHIIYGVFNAVVVLLIADLVWTLAKAYIDHRVFVAEQVGAEDADERARAGRLRTLLPILRNSLGVLILTVAALTVLSGLGVQIAPLIAGAGIFGVAIGFGSQTLVKDILSGVFYMLDDAFRVGEYIQSGSYRGTVESFSLRSVRLRHHRGPIFTVPFGELGAVQNMSRDWVMEKWTISITYDSDVERARKLIKKVGQELAEDPEFAASTLEPLKMQGVDSFGEFAIVLKLKLMTKPGEQFGIKRKAFMMIKKAFEENGIRIAVPTVEISGSTDNEAAVAKEFLRKQKAAQIANASA